REHDMPLREHSPVRYVSKFYGQWDGQTHLEQVSVENLEHIIGSEIGDGISELACHPGYVDEGHATSYRAEREAELRALCDPRIRRTLAERRITLISYRQISKIREELERPRREAEFVSPFRHRSRQSWRRTPPSRW